MTWENIIWSKVVCKISTSLKSTFAKMHPIMICDSRKTIPKTISERVFLKSRCRVWRILIVYPPRLDCNSFSYLIKSAIWPFVDSKRSFTFKWTCIPIFPALTMMLLRFNAVVSIKVGYAFFIPTGEHPPLM